MRIFYLAVLAACTSVAAASAANYTANNKLPFKYEITKVEDVERSGSLFTVVTIKISNGSHDLPSASFHCEAKNAQGNTWDVAGDARNIDAGDTKVVRVTSSGDTSGSFSKATSVDCAVKAFDGGLR